MLRLRQAWQRIPWKAVAGAIVATPAVAILQGTYLLYDYRVNHGQTPHPEGPSRGLVVVRQDSDEKDDDREEHHSEFLWRPLQELLSRKQQQQHADEQPPPKQQILTKSPLRILVIGDSLAAGVGIQEQTTPVLPESIAQALSKASGGRAVVWECVGVPGQCASEIVQEIHHLDELLPKPVTLLRQWQLWQAQQRQLASDRLETVQRKTNEWWLEHQRRQQEEAAAKHDNEPVQNAWVQWWKQTTRQLQTDVDALRQVVLPDDRPQKPPPSSRILTRRTTVLDPQVVEKYDVAVVLTGLNDLKESFLPFMFTKQRADALRAQRDNNNNPSLKDELVHILHALESRMKNSVVGLSSIPEPQTRDDMNDSTTTIPKNDKPQDFNNTPKKMGPLVVFPALPYEPTIFTKYAPLSWFIIPLLDMVDRNKQTIADLYPDRVVYVAAPDATDVSNAEAKKGRQWQDFDVLLQLNDEEDPHQMKNKKNVIQERIESVIQEEHYSDWRMVEEQHEHLYRYDDVFGVTQMRIPSTVRSTMVAPDGIHPSDYGYDVWGRHIGNAIVKEWEKRERWQG